jgi:poly(3-hydroxybutyrate) depolymerase
MQSCFRTALFCAITAVFTPVPGGAADLAELGRYNAPPAESSVSGISSGAFMAVQFGTAWSSVIKGVGVVSGGPYYCAQAQASDILTAYMRPIATATGACMKGPAPELDIFTQMADKEAAAGAIDPLKNLAAQKVYIFHGFNDAVVARSVTDAAAAFYRHYEGDAGKGNLYYQTVIGAGHSFVVLDQPQTKGLDGCTENRDPYIDQCGYDQAGVLLQHMYGAVNPRNAGTLSGAVKSFNQAAYTGGAPEAISMGKEGYVFVPKECEDGAACRVHIALHGCKQNAENIGRKFVDSTGYLNWADTNRIIVLFPQTTAIKANPAACWDWWSYVTHDDSYVTKNGRQIKAIKAMLDALTGGAKPVEASAPAAQAPGNAAVTDVSDTSAALTWTAVPGAESYRVMRTQADAAPALAGSVSTPGFGDSGLAPSTGYRWRVSAVIGGVEGPASSEAAATTRATPAPCTAPGQCQYMQAGH